MLKAINGEKVPECAYIPIADAAFPSPFRSGLEYSAPARGTWNIVHTGMLLPEAHQIFVCASGCLRGVVLTAAEMGAAHRFSTVTIREHNVLDGNMEELIIDGVTDILQKLPERPPAALIYTSCIHHFMGCDLPRVYRILRERFPDVDFADCYMTPTMRKSGLTPDQLMRRQLYSLLRPRPLNMKSVNIIGNDFPTDKTSELCRLVSESGYILRDINYCSTYSEYQEMAESAVNIITNPAAVAAGETLSERLGSKYVYVPLSYDCDEIETSLNTLADSLNIPHRDWSLEKAYAEAALMKASKLIGNTPIELDYTLSWRPLSLARMLISHGFNLTSIYADSFTDEEQVDFEWLKANRPELTIYATVHAGMRMASRKRDGKILALGQKAAYFSGTNHFVNVVETGGMSGFDGIVRLSGLMEEAFSEEKDVRKLIQIKGMGCSCC